MRLVRRDGITSGWTAHPDADSKNAGRLLPRRRNSGARPTEFTNRRRLEFGKIHVIRTGSAITSRTATETGVFGVDSAGDLDLLPDQRLQAIVRNIFDLVHVAGGGRRSGCANRGGRCSRSEEHTSELQSQS